MASLNFKDKESQNMRQKRRKVIVYEYQQNSETKIYEKLKLDILTVESQLSHQTTIKRRSNNGISQ